MGISPKNGPRNLFIIKRIQVLNSLKLLNYWDEWGWHRVTFFGDLKRPVYNIVSLLGFEVVEEA